jgi:signal transduction protein with GAF and PtsI domain
MLMPQFSDVSDASLVLTVDEIAGLAEESERPADTLMNVVALIATRFKTDVCSAYLLEPDRSNLVLAATLGLHPSSIGSLRMPLHEGLSGLVAELLEPVAVADARNHPRYKYFEISGEKEYQSFLGVPLVDRGVLQGVLVVQTKEPRVFKSNEIRMLSAVANQVAPIVSEARTLHCPGSGKALGTRAQCLVELGSRMHRAFPPPEPQALARTESKPCSSAE